METRHEWVYVDLMQSLFFATQAMTVLPRLRLSDIIGRKFVLLIGCLGCHCRCIVSGCHILGSCDHVCQIILFSFYCLTWSTLP